HSNARAICDHPRNLYDEQIQAMIDKNAPIHLVFNPPFVKQHSDIASIEELIKHIEHINQLGGFDHIGFGSDFDGIEDHVTELEHAGQYPNFIEQLLNTYTESDVKKLAYDNFLQRLPS